MTTTMPLAVAAIRRMLQDRPDETYITASLSPSATTVTVSDITKFTVGQVWEFDDGTTFAEDVLIRDKDDTTSTITMKRSHLGSSPISHAQNCVMRKEPRYTFDETAQAINTVLDADLYQEGLFDIVEHQILSSATSDIYNAPSTDCQRFLDVYQQPSSYVEPQRSGIRFTPYPRDADVSLYSNGKYFVIQGNYGIAGGDVYYVSCAHRLGLTTMDTATERIVHLLACAYLMEWGEPRRQSGPANQGDTTVPPNTGIQTAAYFRSLAEELMTKERFSIAQVYPTQRRFVRY